jgi:hypothetical protein
MYLAYLDFNCFIFSISTILNYFKYLYNTSHELFHRILMGYLYQSVLSPLYLYPFSKTHLFLIFLNYNTEILGRNNPLSSYFDLYLLYRYSFSFGKCLIFLINFNFIL